MIRHLVRASMKHTPSCSTFGCHNQASSTLVVQTPIMPAPGFYPYCDECAQRVEQEQRGVYELRHWMAQ